MDNESMNESYASPEENHENGGPRDMLRLFMEKLKKRELKNLEYRKS
jgi:hypothetical protein